MLKIFQSYLSNFSTELSSQIFDCCPRNFLIQEKQNGNVVSTSHWIRPVCYVKNIKGTAGKNEDLYGMYKWILITGSWRVTLVVALGILPQICWCDRNLWKVDLLCHSMNAGWVVGTLKIYLLLSNSLELFKRRGSGDV